MSFITFDQVCKLRNLEKARVAQGGGGLRIELQTFIRQLESGTSSAVEPQTSNRTRRSRAEKARKRFEKWYHSLGFFLTVPMLTASNSEITRRQKSGQMPVYRPATHEVSYEAFMAAVGQGNHWTVVDEAERQKIGWETAATGYWFWAEAQDACPRRKTSRNDLMASVRLLSLEEYVIVWHAVKHLHNRMLDRSTWTWLRTSFGPSGALCADEYDGVVYVRRYSAGYLSLAFDSDGGRAADVVAM